MDVTVGLKIALLLISVLAAGLASLRIIVCSASGRVQLPAGEGLYLAILGGTVVASWLGLTLAELAHFSLPALSLPLLAGAAILFGRPALSLVRLARFPALPSLRRAVTPYGLGFLGTLVLAASLFFQPGEFILGGRDPGIYVNTGHTIARTGAILVRDGLVPTLTAEERALLFGPTPAPWIHSGWPGYQAIDFTQGIFAPHGFHLFPVWLATLEAAGGTDWGLLGTPLLALLGVVSLYFLGRRLFGPGVALLAAFLLAINVAQVWYARYPAAEILVQFLLLSGLYALHLGLRSGNRPALVLAGLTFGLVHLTKVEMIFLPVALGLFLGYEYLTGRYGRGHAIFTGSYILLVGQALLHSALAAPAYTIGQLKAMLPSLDYRALDRADPDLPFTIHLAADLARSNPAVLVVLVLVAMLLILFLAAGKGRLPGASTWVQVRRPWLSTVLVVVVGGLAGYAYFLRPYPTSAGVLARPGEMSDLRSLVWLGWYLSPLGLALAIGGFLHLAATTRDRSVHLLLLLVALGTAPFLYRTLISPDHFWAARRFLPVGIPLLILLASYGLVGIRTPSPLAGALTGSRLTILSRAALVLFLVFSYATATWPFLQHREYDGVRRQIEGLAQVVPPEAILIVEWPAPAQQVATPLALLFHRPTFALRAEGLADSRLPSLVERWTAQGRPVYWLGAAPISMSLPLPQPGESEGPASEPVRQFQLTLVRAEATLDRLPQRVDQETRELWLYRLRPK